MIRTIKFSCEAYVMCKSGFYCSSDILNWNNTYEFHIGVNKLIGEIDSGVWAVGYLFSFYNIKPKDYSLTDKECLVKVDGVDTPLKDFSKRCCYLDEELYPLFSSKRKTVFKLIEAGLKKSGIERSADEICRMFMLDQERIHRPVRCVGNERFRAMAAIGYAHGKEVFCFPWLSKRRFKYYGNNIQWLLETLEELDLIAIVPIAD